ncbi:hypothetical protein CAL7716_057040 [Calothrix sp. PCC 7716]|nr:hypothetical protein CAL7716_057040 [Calothrix sp. PCC 7716]
MDGVTERLYLKTVAMKNKSSDNWYTPPHIVDLVVQVLGEIHLDPCALIW